MPREDPKNGPPRLVVVKQSVEKGRKVPERIA